MSQMRCPECGDPRIAVHELGYAPFIMFAFGVVLVIFGVTGMAGDVFFASLVTLAGIYCIGRPVVMEWHDPTTMVCKHCGHRWSREVRE